MLKGIIALFTSGIIFNPMVLLGIISGSYTILKLEPEKIRALFADYRFYGIVFVVAVLYTLVFGRVYQEGGMKVDTPATALRVVWNFIYYIVAFALAMSFVVMFSIF